MEAGEDPIQRAFGQFGLEDVDRAAWEDSDLFPDRFEEWLTDRLARRPAGPKARAVYGAEDVHLFARRAIFDALALQAGERLLDVGCGGGLLLREALKQGVSATGLDHSEEMVSLARDRAPGAEVLLGSAERLPFADHSFTAVTMSIVLMFLPKPVSALRECRRVLVVGGRIAIYTSSAQLRGSPAAPEPLASHSYFYDDHELADMARQADFAEVTVASDRGGQLLTART